MRVHPQFVHPQLSIDVRHHYGLLAHSVFLNLTARSSGLIVLDEQGQSLEPAPRTNLETLLNLLDRLVSSCGGGETLLSEYDPVEADLPWAMPLEASA